MINEHHTFSHFILSVKTHLYIVYMNFSYTIPGIINYIDGHTVSWMVEEIPVEEILRVDLLCVLCRETFINFFPTS